MASGNGELFNTESLSFDSTLDSLFDVDFAIDNHQPRLACKMDAQSELLDAIMTTHVNSGSIDIDMDAAGDNGNSDNTAINKSILSNETDYLGLSLSFDSSFEVSSSDMNTTQQSKGTSSKVDNPNVKESKVHADTEVVKEESKQWHPAEPKSANNPEGQDTLECEVGNLIDSAIKTDDMFKGFVQLGKEQESKKPTVVKAETVKAVSSKTRDRKSRHQTVNVVDLNVKVTAKEEMKDMPIEMKGIITVKDAIKHDLKDKMKQPCDTKKDTRATTDSKIKKHVEQKQISPRRDSAHRKGGTVLKESKDKSHGQIKTVDVKGKTKSRSVSSSKEELLKAIESADLKTMLEKAEADAKSKDRTSVESKDKGKRSGSRRSSTTSKDSDKKHEAKSGIVTLKEACATGSQDKMGIYALGLEVAKLTDKLIQLQKENASVSGASDNTTRDASKVTKNAGNEKPNEKRRRLSVPPVVDMIDTQEETGTVYDYSNMALPVAEAVNVTDATEKSQSAVDNNKTSRDGTSSQSKSKTDSMHKDNTVVDKESEPNEVNDQDINKLNSNVEVTRKYKTDGISNVPDKKLSEEEIQKKFIDERLPQVPIKAVKTIIKKNTTTKKKRAKVDTPSAKTDSSKAIADASKASEPAKEKTVAVVNFEELKEKRQRNMGVKAPLPPSAQTQSVYKNMMKKKKEKKRKQAEDSGTLSAEPASKVPKTSKATEVINNPTETSKVVTSKSSEMQQGAQSVSICPRSKSSETKENTPSALVVTAVCPGKQSDPLKSSSSVDTTVSSNKSRSGLKTQTEITEHDTSVVAEPTNDKDKEVNEEILSSSKGDDDTVKPHEAMEGISETDTSSIIETSTSSTKVDEDTNEPSTSTSTTNYMEVDHENENEDFDGLYDFDNFDQESVKSEAYVEFEDYLMNDMTILEEEDEDGDEFESDEELPDEEVDALLEEGIKGTRARHELKEGEFISREKKILEEKGTDPFDILPEDWMIVCHNSGMPIYLNRVTRVCTLSRPYFIGAGSTRKHAIPISAIPCLQYRRALAQEADPSAASDTAGVTSATADVGTCGETMEAAPPTSIVDKQEDNTEDNAEGNTGSAEGEPHPQPKLTKMEDLGKTIYVEPEDVYNYCSNLFEFKKVNIKKFKTWREKRAHLNHEKKLERQEQVPRLAADTQLITCPIPRENQNKKTKKKDFVLNPHGKTAVCILHEFAQNVLRSQPSYVFKEIENAETPFKATIYINQIQYGTGIASGKKQAKNEAAKQTLGVFMPFLAEKWKNSFAKTKLAPDSDLEFFEQITIEDPRVTDLCSKAALNKPYQILQDCLNRNFGMGDTQLHIDKKMINNQKTEYSLTVGKHEVKVVCKNKREARQFAAQAMLQKLHPNLTSWAAIMRLYSAPTASVFAEANKEQVQSDKHKNFEILANLKKAMHCLKQRKDVVKAGNTLSTTAAVNL